jgi:hypothetical protein
MENGESEETFGRWYSDSTWIALGLLLFYLAFTFLLPFIPAFIMASGGERILLRYAPIVALLLWVAGMWDRYRRRKVGGQVVWTGFRYGIISLGLSGILVMFVCWLTPKYIHIRQARQLQEQMHKKADVQAIRLWAESYQPPAADDSHYPPATVDVPKKEWPECIKKLDPQYVTYFRATKVVSVIWGGGFLTPWGLCVGPKGAGPAKEYGGYTLPLEDGAWVWAHLEFTD